MKDINREGILRMIGMRDTAGFLSKINALFLDIYDENGKLAEYSTQLIVTSKNITLLAQRVTDDEQDIANLTVTAQQISASVSSLQTTVSGHTEQIASLTITTNSITQSVSSLTTTVNGHTSQISTLRTDLNGISATVTADHTTLGTHTTQIGSLQVTTNSISQSVSNISDEVDAVSGTVTTHTSQISTLRTDLNGISATVTADHTTLGTHTTQIGSLQVTTNNISQSVSNISDEVDAVSGTVTTHTSQISTLRTDLNGISATVTADHTTLGTHTTQIGSLQVTTNSISGRVTAIEGDYVKEAEISLMVKKDSNGYISNASIKADNILFTFTKTTNFISGGQTVMSIDNGGNLRILGTLTAGCVIGNLNVDNSGNISGTGSVTTDNVVAGYKTQEITVPSTNNSVTDIYCASGMFVFLKGSTSANTHFFRLPTLSDVRSVLGITSTNKFFSARMVILNQSEAYHCYLTYRDGYGATTNQPWKMTFDDTHRTGGDAVTQLAVGDYIEILLIYNPTKGEYRAYEVVHNN